MPGGLFCYRRNISMKMDVYGLKDNSVVAVCYSEFKSTCDEYTVVSLFREHSGMMHFGQFIGYDSIRQYAGRGYDVSRTKLDGKNNLYTVTWHDSFKYKLPLPYKERRAIIGPSEQACKEILKKLVGIDDWAVIGEFFTVTWLKDELPTGRHMLLVGQKHYSDETMVRQNTADVLEQFKTLDRAPVYFKGGELGDIG
jgi:hypothetical protein